MSVDVPSIALTAIGTLATSFLGVHLALQKSRSERQWQAMHEAYQEIMSAIADIRYWADEAHADAAMLTSVPEPSLSAAYDAFIEGKRRLSKFAYVGALLISPQVSELLQELIGEIAREEMRYLEAVLDGGHVDSELVDHSGKIRAIVDRHLDPIASAARRDLEAGNIEFAQKWS